MPPKKISVGRSTRHAHQVAASRAAETADQRALRNETNRLSTSSARASESTERRAERQEGDRIRHSTARASESAEQRTERLERLRARASTSRTMETEEQRTERQEVDRTRHSRSRLRTDLTLEAFNYYKDYDYSAHPNVVIGEMNKLCPHCKALTFLKEPPGMCCSNGKVKLPPLEEPPEPLKTYVSGTTAASKSFLNAVRSYNSCFQMTSFGAKVIRDGIITTFKIQGQVCHKLGALLPMPDEDAKFLQIYFMGDDNAELDQRCGISTKTKREVIEELQTFFHEHNQLVRLFKTALDRMPSDDYRIVIRADKTPSGEHERRFNAPTIDDVAIVMVGPAEKNRDIVLSRRDEQLQRVFDTHRSYDALQYPILFWQGQDGYHFHVMQVNPATGAETAKKVSSNDLLSRFN